jgi:hypothetical protein
VNKTFESRLVEQCAPTLAGIKPGSLFPYAYEKGENVTEILEYWNDKLAGKGVCLRRLRENDNRHLILVFRPKELERILCDQNVSLFLRERGYCGCGKLDDYVEILSRRMNAAPPFSHEIGVFLGYPLNDVIGFINNEGQNSCCCGYWKVYGERESAEHCFRRFDKCTSIYKKLFYSGKTVLQLTVAA